MGAFLKAAYKVEVVGLRAEVAYKGEYGLIMTSDVSPQDVNIEDYVAIIIPRGRAPDRMRTNKGSVNLVKAAARKEEVIAVSFTD